LRRETALALLDVVGDDAAGVGRVASELTGDETVNFTVAALVARAERDTDGAWAAALALPDPEQRRLALQRLAPVLAARDPLGTLAHLDDIPSRPLEEEFLAATLDAWAMLDPESVFAYIDTLEKRRVPAAGLAFAALAAHDPERLLAIAHELPWRVAAAARTPAIEALAVKDFAAALAQIDAVSPGPQRDTIYAAAATAYGEHDPEAAWRWAETVDSVRATSGVLRGMEKVEPGRAVNLVISGLMSNDAQLRDEMRRYLPTVLGAMAEAAASDEIVRALDQLAILNDPSIDTTMRNFVSSWSSRAPADALDWSLRNLDRVGPRSLANLGIAVGRTDVSLARATLARLSDESRRFWVTGTSRALAENSLEQGRAWAFEMPHGPLRDAALAEYLGAEARGGAIDQQMFTEFSDAAARDTAANRVAAGLSCDGHEALALEIARAHITDPELRAATERQIEDHVGRGGSIGGSLQNMICEWSR
jgi:hypothetical protein